jgi:arylsulfatase
MKRLGVLDERWKITPQAGNWVTLDRRPWEARCMEVYAAMIDCMDQGIGRLVETLKKNGQYDNTLILYLQDNGACAETIGRNGPFQPRADKPTLPPLSKDYQPPALTRKQTRDGYPVREGQGVMPGGADTYVAYGLNWANISNTPFREYKHWQHEGGISTPLIAHWPRGIKTARQGDEETGRLVQTPTHLIDIMATCVDVSGTAYPTKLKDNPITPMEGVSLAPAFHEQPIVRRQPLFWEHEGNRAIRSGEWKLVSKHPGPWELYKMTTDRTEMNDLAAQQPERVKEMAAQWDAWAKRVGVLSWPLRALRDHPDSLPRSTPQQTLINHE